MLKGTPLVWRISAAACLAAAASWSFPRLHGLFPDDGYMPHGHCYLWEPGLVRLHLASDSLIGIAYVAISAMLGILVYRARRDIPFSWVFLAFGLFIVCCGGTHFMEVWTLWHADYWQAGALKLLTAVVSVLTAAALPGLVPQVVALAEKARLFRELDQLKGRFFANVSHELRTPLTLILAPVRGLLAGETSPDRRSKLEVVERNALTLLKQVNNLLDITKLEAGKMRLDYAGVDLARLVRLVCANFSALAAEKGMALGVEAPPALPADVDVEKLERVLFNLLSNAFKFTPEGGEVRCSLRAEGGRAVLCVSDTGPGIPAAARAAVFERFQQLETGPTRRFGGTGLGLSIAREFVELHKGTIMVEDAAGGGALFRVSLPLAAPPGVRILDGSAGREDPAAELARQALAEHRPRAAPGAADPQKTDQPLVLVVEDNPDMNRFIAETLSAEHRVATAGDGKEGLEKARALRPDLVVSDVMMPGMDGGELLRALRSDPLLAAVPVVILTAKAEDDLRPKLLRQGAQDYLQKPFSAEELRCRVKNLVDVKRARERLEETVVYQGQDLEAMAAEVAARSGELRKALDEVRDLNAGLERRVAERTRQLVRANEELTSFSYSVAHDLRAPLRKISGFNAILKEDLAGKLSPESAECLSKIQGVVSHMDGIIAGLLRLARITQVEPKLEAVDLSALVEAAAAELRQGAPDRAVECRVAPGITAFGDRVLLGIIVHNLLENAWKFTSKNPRARIEFGASEEAGERVYVLRDDGVGFDMALAGSLFGAFRRLHRPKDFPGSGIGLATVQRAVHRHGGRVWGESKPGAGAAFFFTLGAARPAPGARG